MAATINDLPDEILEFIFGHMPPYNDLKSCSLVCKRWTHVVSNVCRHTNINFQKGISEFRLRWKPMKNNEVGPTIAGRFSHSSVVHNNSMYVFGGGSSTNTTFNDLWRFDLSKREWVRPLSMGTYPSPKACASLVCHNNLLILFGGWRHPSSYPPYQPWRLFDELHVYDIAQSKWILVTTIDGPPPMTGHSASIHNDSMVVFGGYTCTDGQATSTNDIWSLDLRSFSWSKKEATNPRPAPRYGQHQMVLDNRRCLVMGGCGGPNNMFNDAWILDMNDSVWKWHSVAVLNKKWAATHMWCNPACRVGNKIVVLGPAASVASDFQIVRHKMIPTTSRHNLTRNDNPFQDNHHNQQQQQPVPRPLSAAINNNNNNNNNNNHHNIINNNAQSRHRANSQSVNNDNHDAGRSNEDDTANRLQKNLQLHCRRTDNDEYNLPKRFGEALPTIHDRIPMAAFNVHDESLNSTGERRLESLRRMEEKIQAMRRIIQLTPEPPKRVKRNCIGLFVCDISQALDGYKPTLEWVEYRNYGMVCDAPDRLILSSLVTGNGELIMFGGLRKEPNPTNNTMYVSNSMHFLQVPRGII